MRSVASLSAVVLLVASVAAACTSGGASGSGLTGKTWALTAITEKTPAFQGVIPAADAGRYTIAFAADGTVSGKADCNQFTGTYKTSGSNGLTIALGAMTMAFCPDGEFANLYVHALSNTASYAITGETLTLTLTDGGTLSFNSTGGASAAPSAAASAQASAAASAEAGASPPADLVGKTWKLTAVTETVPAFQGVVPGADQAKYTITFQADGTFSAQADCNMVSGTYAMCPPGSLGDLFVAGLGQAKSFAVAGNQLTLTLEGEGTLTFTT
jgi:heat shock protein HslJ